MAKTSKPPVTEAADVIISGNATAPFVFFEHAPTFGVQCGVIRVELTAVTVLPKGTGTKVELVSAGHLRCSVDAARELINALNGALLMAQPVENPEGRAN